jgi:hypothetical protein
LSAEETDLSFLEYLSDDELREMLGAQEELERRLAEDGPQNDDELHAWIKAELGIDIPRESVCEGHDAPFTFIADLFFERTEAALLMANRGGSKTFLVALLHWLNSRFKPGCESATFGATEAQSLRAYAHLKNWIYDNDGNKRPEIATSIMRETTWRNGSKVEVLPGTPAAVNGPHPQKAHADEVELMDDGTWSESRNMTVSKRLPNGKLIKPQDIATSTRKGPNGRMQELIDEIEASIKQGLQPPRKLYQWCIKETAAQVKNCQVANPDLPEDEKCQCHVIAKGEWEPNRPRLLRDICNGDFFKSRGWQPYGDVVKQFRENDQETFEVQQLCAKPEMSHHYVPGFSTERYGLKNFDPDPANGPIFLAVDWGGTNPHAVNWYQLLAVEIEAEMFIGGTRRLKEGTVVCFDEIYIAEIGNDKLADLVIAKENRYRERYPDWRPIDRFADPQGKAARMDWRDKGLKTSWHTTREFEEHVKVVKSSFEDDLMYVDAIKCPMWVSEIKAWRRDEKTEKQIDEFNHCMSNFRYAMANIRKVKRRALRSRTLPTSRSIPRQVRVVSQRREGPIGLRGGKNEYDEWRKGLGEPVTRVKQ